MFTVLHVYFHPRLVETKDEAWFCERAAQAVPNAERYHWIREERLLSIAVSLSSVVEIDAEVSRQLLDFYNTDDMLKELSGEEAVKAIWLRRPWTDIALYREGEPRREYQESGVLKR